MVINVCNIRISFDTSFIMSVMGLYGSFNPCIFSTFSLIFGPLHITRRLSTLPAQNGRGEIRLGCLMGMTAAVKTAVAARAQRTVRMRCRASPPACLSSKTTARCTLILMEKQEWVSHFSFQFVGYFRIWLKAAIKSCGFKYHEMFEILHLWQYSLLLLKRQSFL